MNTKSFLELLTLSTNLYRIAKDTNALARIHEYSEKAKLNINEFVKEKITDEDGNELEFVDKMIYKLHEAKVELERKIEEVVAATYEKMHIAHTDRIKILEQQLESLSKELSLANSRLEALEGKN